MFPAFLNKGSNPIPEILWFGFFLKFLIEKVMSTRRKFREYR